MNASKRSSHSKHQPGARTLSEDDRRVPAVWAADCANRRLSLFEAQAPSDTRPREAIDGLRALVVDAGSPSGVDSRCCCV
jgi:hypothetical protein